MKRTILCTWIVACFCTALPGLAAVFEITADIANLAAVHPNERMTAFAKFKCTSNCTGGWTFKATLYEGVSQKATDSSFHSTIFQGLEYRESASYYADCAALYGGWFSVALASRASPSEEHSDTSDTEEVTEDTCSQC